jgi:hypothetical protein
VRSERKQNKAPYHRIRRTEIGIDLMPDMCSESDCVSPWGGDAAILIELSTPTPPSCERCQRPFQPRGSNSGGRPQRFCSPTCRKAANNSKRSQRLTAASQDVGLNSFENSQRLTGTPTSPSETLQRIASVSPTPPAPKEPDFDWKDEDEVIIHDQPTVAVYLNTRNQVVIRSQGDGYWTEDQWVYISRPNLTALISRLQEYERGEL